jgi:hypothetical protein
MLVCFLYFLSLQKYYIRNKNYLLCICDKAGSLYPDTRQAHFESFPYSHLEAGCDYINILLYFRVSRLVVTYEFNLLQTMNKLGFNNCTS